MEGLKVQEAKKIIIKQEFKKQEIILTKQKMIKSSRCEYDLFNSLSTSIVGH
jgi:hypothetical protein